MRKEIPTLFYTVQKQVCNNAKKVHSELRAPGKWRRPTLPRVCSTIGATVLNFSVRNGKRWNHSAITTGNILLDIVRNTSSVLLFLVSSWTLGRQTGFKYFRAGELPLFPHRTPSGGGRECMFPAWSFGQLVVLGFDVTVFTPAPYQRHRLWRPSKEISSCGRLRT